MHVELLFPSLYLKAADIETHGRDLVITIDRVALEELKLAGGAKKTKPVVYRKGRTAKGEEPKRLVLNITNARTIAQVTGESDTDNWSGHKIALYATTTECGGKTVPCIRVRPTKPRNGGPPTSRSKGATP